MCRWLENLSQLSLSQQQVFLTRRDEIEHTFTRTEGIHQSRVAKQFALDCAWIIAARPKDGVSGYEFNPSSGFWEKDHSNGH